MRLSSPRVIGSPSNLQVVLVMGTDLNSKRIFLLGPSHHYHLTKAALSRCTHYATPLGNLVVDKDTTAKLHASGQFQWMSQSVDEDEHSLEMHLPYIYKILSK